jgi:hypothetical protein
MSSNWSVVSFTWCLIKTQQLYFLEGVFKMYQRFHTTAVPGPCTHLCSPVRGSSSGVGFSELLLKCSKLGTRFHLSRATIAILFFWQSWDPNPQPVHPRQLLYHYVPQAALKFMLLLPPSPKCWDYRCVPSNLAFQFTFKCARPCINLEAQGITVHTYCRHSSIPFRV